MASGLSKASISTLPVVSPSSHRRVLRQAQDERKGRSIAAEKALPILLQLLQRPRRIFLQPPPRYLVSPREPDPRMALSVAQEPVKGP